MTIWDLCDGRITAVGDKGGAMTIDLHKMGLSKAKEIGFFILLREEGTKNHYRIARPEEHRTLAYRLDDVRPMSIEKAMDWLEDWNSPDNALNATWRVDGAFLYDDFSKNLVKSYMPLKRGRIGAADRMAVYNKCGGHCAYCGKPIKYEEMQVDHVESHYRHMGKDEIGNYLPACRDCNGLKSDYLLEEFRDKLIPDCAKKSSMGGMCFRRQDTRSARIAKAYGLDKNPKKKIIFYFEEYEDEKRKEMNMDMDIENKIRDLMMKLGDGQINYIVLKLKGEYVSYIRRVFASWYVDCRDDCYGFVIDEYGLDVFFDDAEGKSL